MCLFLSSCVQLSCIYKPPHNRLPFFNNYHTYGRGHAGLNTHTVFPLTSTIGGRPNRSLSLRGAPVEFLKNGNSALENPYKGEKGRSKKGVWGSGVERTHSSHIISKYALTHTATIHTHVTPTLPYHTPMYMLPMLLHTCTPTHTHTRTHAHTPTSACRSSCFTVALKLLLVRALGHRLM